MEGGRRSSQMLIDGTQELAPLYSLLKGPEVNIMKRSRMHAQNLVAKAFKQLQYS